MINIINNKFLSVYKLSSRDEIDALSSNLRYATIESLVKFPDRDYRFYYCLEKRNSLNGEVLVAFVFNSDFEISEFRVLLWPDHDFMILHSGEEIWIIEHTEVKKSFKLDGILVGLYITDQSHLLILDEISLRLIDREGNLLIRKFYSRLIGADLRSNQLYIYTDEDEQLVIDLRNYDM